MDIALYYAPTTCALAPYITLTEAGADFEVRPLDFRRRQQLAPDYLNLNPKHKVPMLVVDGATLTESVAIQQWIARAFPDARLLPSDPWQELQAISILSWCSSGIHPYLRQIHSPGKVCETPGSEASVVELSRKVLDETFAIASDLLAGREYFFDHFTAADAHFFWCVRRATQLDVEMSKFPHCLSHFERVKARESARKLLAYEKSVLERFASAA